MKGMPFCFRNWKNSHFKTASGASSFGLSFARLVFDFGGFAFSFVFGFFFNSSSSSHFVEVFLSKFFSVDEVDVVSVFKFLE